MDQRPKRQEAEDQTELGRLARELGVPANSYGEPDWTALRELHSWWIAEGRITREEFHAIVEWWRRCLRIRQQSLIWLVSFAATGAGALALQIWPDVRGWLKVVLVNVLSE